MVARQNLSAFPQEKQEMSQLIVWNTSPYLLVEKEKLVYTLESLVAEFGEDKFYNRQKNIQTLYHRWDAWSLSWILLPQPLGRCRDCRRRRSCCIQTHHSDL